MKLIFLLTIKLEGNKITRKKWKNKYPNFTKNIYQRHKNK